jgi:hypothetical protein
MAAAQNPQHVVLIRRQIGRRLEKLLPRVEDASRGDPQTEQHLLLAGVELALLFEGARNGSGHDDADISRLNDYRQEDFRAGLVPHRTIRRLSTGARVICVCHGQLFMPRHRSLMWPMRPTVLPQASRLCSCTAGPTM